MMDEILIKAIFLLLGTGVGLLGFHIKQNLIRITKLEDKLNGYITEEECRRIIKDHIDPLRDDIKRIDNKLDQLIDLQIRTHSS